MKPTDQNSHRRNNHINRRQLLMSGASLLSFAALSGLARPAMAPNQRGRRHRGVVPDVRRECAGRCRCAPCDGNGRRYHQQFLRSRFADGKECRSCRARQCQDQAGVRRPSVRSAEGPGGGRAPDHPGEGVRPDRMLSVVGFLDRQRRRRTLWPAVPVRQFLVAEPGPPRPQVFLPSGRAGRNVFGRDVRFSRCPEGKGQEDRNRRPVFRGHDLRHQFVERPAQACGRARLQAGRRHQVQIELAVAERRSAAAQGRRSGCADAVELHHRCDPADEDHG